MKFSLFFELQLARPDRTTEAQLFRDCIAQVELADALGYHGVWAVEHHGLREYSHSSAPEVFLAFAAARTRRVRLGHGVTLLPYRYNHPIRIAERIATLDLLSGGRVDWGTGKSSSRVEWHAFENDVDTLHAQWLEALEIIPRMWKDEVFSHEGTFFRIPPTQIVPKPMQAPHPPMFAGCSRPETAALVGRMGLGALNFAFGNDDYLREKVTEYRDAVRASAPVGRAKNNHFACTPATLVLADDRKACAYGLRGEAFFLGGLQAYTMSGERPVGDLPLRLELPADDEVEAARARRNTPGSEMGSILGDPSCARETVQRFKDIGVDELILVMQMGTVPHALVMESIRTFAEFVMPYFV